MKHAKINSEGHSNCNKYAERKRSFKENIVENG